MTPIFVNSLLNNELGSNKSSGLTGGQSCKRPQTLKDGNVPTLYNKYLEYLMLSILANYR